MALHLACSSCITVVSFALVLSDGTDMSVGRDRHVCRTGQTCLATAPLERDSTVHHTPLWVTDCIRRRLLEQLKQTRLCVESISCGVYETIKPAYIEFTARN